MNIIILGARRRGSRHRESLGIVVSYRPKRTRCVRLAQLGARTQQLREQRQRAPVHDERAGGRILGEHPTGRRGGLGDAPSARVQTVRAQVPPLRATRLGSEAQGPGRAPGLSPDGRPGPER
jgi:hypothetical protein